MNRETNNGAWFEPGRGFDVLVLFLVLSLSVLPAARLFLAAFVHEGALAFGPAVEVLESRGAIRALWGSLETATLSSVVAVVLGAFMAVVLGLTNVRSRRTISFLFALSMMISPQVVALGFLHLAGPSSAILGALDLAPAPGSSNPVLGRGGIVAVLGIHHAPLVLVVLAVGLKRIPASLVEAAKIDGASPWRITRDIVLPLLRPHLVGAGLTAFLAGVGNFGIPALLGLPVNYLTLPTLIYQRLSSFGPGILADVAILGLLVAALACLCVLLSHLVLKREVVRFESDESFQPYWDLGHWRLAWEVFPWTVIVVVLGLPLASLLSSALVPSYGMPIGPETITLENFIEVLIRQDVTTRALCNSLLFAGGSALAMASISIPLAYWLGRHRGAGRWLASATLEIPYVVPGVVLAIACILLFLKPLPGIGISLYGTSWIIVFAYVARFLPVVLKPVLATMEQIEVAQEEAAMLDGAGPVRRLITIVAPSLLPAVAAGALLAFLLAFGELTVSALLWSAGTETIGVVLFSLEEAGLASQAAALGVISVIVVGVTMFAVERLGARLSPEVLPWSVAEAPSVSGSDRQFTRKTGLPAASPARSRVNDLSFGQPRYSYPLCHSESLQSSNLGG